jgi:MarR family transcriptional regulator for hemolysin
MKVNTESAEWNPGASVGFWLNNASRSLLRLHDARLREFGFAMAQLPVLIALEDGAALPQKELARRARIEPPSMVELIARMEKAGLVKRSPHPDDGRVSLISLTPRARKQVPRAKEALIQGEADATLGLSAHERTQLRELLKRVAHNLGLEE